MEDRQTGRLSREQMLAMAERAQRVLRTPSFHDIRLPVIDLPKVELPQFTMIGAEMAEVSERWRRAMAPLTAIGEGFRLQMEAVQAAMAPLADQFRWIEEQERQCERLERAG